MSRREQGLLMVAALASLALMLVLALTGHPELLAYASPLLVVAVPLLAGRYFGEETLERLRMRTVRKRRRVRALAAPAVRRPSALVPRGGRLIAHSLAERGPPAPALS